MEPSSIPAPTQPQNIDANDPHTITAPLEIQSVLRNVQKQRSLLHVHVPNSVTAMISTILEVDGDKNLLVFDISADNLSNNRVQQANRILVEASLEKIHVRFACGQVKPCEFEGKPALCAPLPQALSYLQRRDFYRINTPITSPVICKVPVHENNRSKVISLPLSDISGGGIGVYDNHEMPDISVGAIYDNCEISLPDVGVIKVSLRVQHALTQELPSGKTRIRLGCAFVRPSGPTMNMVQRYVGKLERELIAKRRGFS